jgi:hypothetical protein
VRLKTIFTRNCPSSGSMSSARGGGREHWGGVSEREARTAGAARESCGRRWAGCGSYDTGGSAFVRNRLGSCDVAAPEGQGGVSGGDRSEELLLLLMPRLRLRDRGMFFRPGFPGPVTMICLAAVVNMSATDSRFEQSTCRFGVGRQTSAVQKASAP